MTTKRIIARRADGMGFVIGRIVGYVQRRGIGHYVIKSSVTGNLSIVTDRSHSIDDYRR